jgi:hypothetical protein
MKRALFLVLSAHLLIAGVCGKPATLDSGWNPDHGTPLIELSHDLVDFGEVAVGDGVDHVVVLTVSNAGDADLHIQELGLEDPDGPFGNGPLGSVLLVPGGSTTIELSYEPTTAATDSTRLFIDSDDPWNPTVDVWLSGQGIAPVLSISPEGALFTDGTIGCEGTESILLANLGNATLTVLELAFEDQASTAGEWSFEGLEDDNADDEGLVDLEPGEHRLMALSYSPLDEVEDLATLTVSSDDPANPERAVAYQGEAAAASWQEDSFEQPLDAAVDMIVALDKGGSMNDDISLVTTNLVQLASGLVGTDIDFQLAISGEDGGCVNGADIRIDGGFTSTEATTTVTTMINISGPYNNNTERAFTQLRDIIAETGAGGCNEGLVREHAGLHLVAISDEPEQSTESWKWHLAELQATKADPDDVVIHGVGGDYPGGCGSATAFTGVYEATAATGGSFLSICASDWWESLLSTVEHVEAFHDSFELSQPAVAGTIIVTVDDVSTPDGWRYDADSTSVIFETEHIPDGGATVDIDYAVQADCAE